MSVESAVKDRGSKFPKEHGSSEAPKSSLTNNSIRKDVRPSPAQHRGAESAQTAHERKSSVATTVRIEARGNPETILLRSAAELTFVTATFRPQIVKFSRPRPGLRLLQQQT